MKLYDKVAVITGAARGIGKAIAERYVKEGAKVVIADLNEEAADAAASALGPNAFALKLDVTDQASIDAMVAATVSKFGGADYLVNNAGLFDPCSDRRDHARKLPSLLGDRLERKQQTLDIHRIDNVDAMFAKYENLKPGEKERVVGASVPFGRMARPDEIGGIATFLASEDADYIVAQTYNIDGGNWMS